MNIKTENERDVVPDYGFLVGDSVFHIKDNAMVGFVTELDADYDLGDVTTCRVVWGAISFKDAKETPREEQDIQWTNKLLRVQ